MVLLLVIGIVSYASGTAENVMYFVIFPDFESVRTHCFPYVPPPARCMLLVHISHT